MLLKIVSGGQTGVDRAALDVALKHGIECGGWCPEGRLDEVGQIPTRYPVRELPGGTFDDRTRANVKDSDGTVIFYFEELRGGSAFTLECCEELKKPCCLIDAQQLRADEAGKRLRAFLDEANVEVMNAAGPRQSDWPEGYAYARAAIEAALKK